MKTIVHIISHSHWDREWYMAFEQHRLKLIKLIDDTMELFEKDPSFRSFHLDGQTIILDDYLEIKPENKEKIEACIQNGKFLTGPWYILQDEFLASGESSVRNLLTGMREAEQFGNLCRVGYFPDAFGNAGQMPQLLKQAGMKAVVFGRGVKPVGFNNMTMAGGEYESSYSEMNWESPDGSSLTGILFANWYNNGAEIPAEPEAAAAFWEKGLEKARNYAGTRHLLFMNGCDHQPVQKDLGAAMETARRLYPDIEFIHSDFDTYVEAVCGESSGKISTVRGELTSQETNGFWTLVNTTSSRVDLKQRNRRCETALEKEAEPMAVMAALLGQEYPKASLRYSWKTLMQNHPHDSICGCSVDEVNDEMKIRFDKSLQVAKGLFDESRAFLTGRINTEALVSNKQGRILPLSVVNTTGWKRSGVVCIIMDYDRSYDKDLTAACDQMARMSLPHLVLKDAKGHTVAAEIEDNGVQFGYTLPADRFRQPYMARQVKVVFEAVEIPAFGYGTYYIESGEADEIYRENSLVTEERTMENERLKVEIHEDGSYSLTDKSSGRSYERIGYYEESGDIGNEYIYVRPASSQVITTRDTKAFIELVEDEQYQAVYRIRHRLEVPKSADQLLESEQSRKVDIFERRAGRSEETVSMEVVTEITLERSAAGVRVETTIQNTAKDHRIRVMVPTGLHASTHMADSVFEVVERNNRHGSQWKNPSGCEHQQNFVAMADDEAGILVANFGLYEYEILPDDRNTIAVTLLRAVGEMGDWGVFPTPGAQMQDTYTLSYGIVPFRKAEMTQAYREGYQFQTGLSACQLEIQRGILPLGCGFFDWSGEGLNLTGMKMKEESSDIMVRFVNNTREPVTLHITKKAWFASVYKSNVIEERLISLEERKGGFETVILPYEIATVGIGVKE